jgi:hypothetical protein
MLKKRGRYFEKRNAPLEWALHVLKLPTFCKSFAKEKIHSINLPPNTLETFS